MKSFPSRRPGRHFVLQPVRSARLSGAGEGVGVVYAATGRLAPVVGIPLKERRRRCCPRKISDITVEVHSRQGRRLRPTQSVADRQAADLGAQDPAPWNGPSDAGVANVPVVAEGPAPVPCRRGSRQWSCPMDDKKRWVFRPPRTATSSVGPSSNTPGEGQHQDFQAHRLQRPPGGELVQGSFPHPGRKGRA